MTPTVVPRSRFLEAKDDNTGESRKFWRGSPLLRIKDLARGRGYTLVFLLRF
jgi:hypothetical protein